MLAVARRNPEFRRLWYAQLCSNGGDWLSRVAVLTLIGSLSSAEEAAGVGALFGIELAIRLLPYAVLGPIAGPIADRFPRRVLMLTADLMRALLVLLLLLVDEPSELPLLYTVLALQMGTGIFFDSARSGALPNTLPKAQLHEAYALTAATWSVMLTVGSLSGSLLVEAVSVRGVFIIDALTYVASAFFVGRLKLPPTPEHADPMRWRDIVLATDLRRGLAHVRSLGLLPAVLAKTFWGPAGGYLVLLSLVANERFTLPEDPESAAFALGLFLAARGVGTAIGPVLGRRFLGSSDRDLRIQIGGGFAFGAIGYALLPFTGSVWSAAAVVAFSHIGGGAIWVGATTLWQKHIDDSFRGRVHALEFLGMTLAFTIGGLFTGFLFDSTNELATTIWSTSAAVAVSAVLWGALARRYRWRSAEASADGEVTPAE